MKLKQSETSVLRTNFIDFPRSSKIRFFIPDLSSCSSMFEDDNSYIAS